MNRPCPVCERPVRDTVLCKYCADTLVEYLSEVPDLLVELEISATRQGKTAARSSGGRSAETPLPYGQRASDAIRQLSWVLRFWAGVLCRDGSFTALAAATYLRLHIHQIASHAMAEKAYDQITQARAHAYEVIDRPPDSVPAGQCGVELEDGRICLEVLYGDPDRASVRCRCGAEHAMDRSWMLTAVRDEEWTAAEIGRVTPGVTAAMVRRYAQRGLLTSVGLRELGRRRTVPTYRVGAVLDVVAGRQREAS